MKMPPPLFRNLMILSFLAMLFFPLLSTIVFLTIRPRSEVGLATFLEYVRFLSLSLPFFIISVVLVFLSIPIGNFLSVWLLKVRYSRHQVGILPYFPSITLFRFISRAILPFSILVFLGTIGMLYVFPLVSIEINDFQVLFLGLELVRADAHAALHFMFLPLVTILIFPVYFADDIRVCHWTLVSVDDDRILDAKSAVFLVLSFLKGVFGIGSVGTVFIYIFQILQRAAVLNVLVMYFLQKAMLWSGVLSATVFIIIFFYWRFEEAKSTYIDQYQQSGSKTVTIRVEEV
ncbi:MAG: hypothetical protein ACFFDI_08965 [Promethearchaeota archaeon]